MKKLSKSVMVIASCGAIALLVGAYRGEREAARIVISGTIHAEFSNDACAALSPAGSERFRLNPADLNDGKLDPVELSAIQEGCTLTAAARAPNGMPLTDVFLVLRRAEAPDGPFKPFIAASRSDASGIATWRFFPSPNTDFIYEVMSPNPVGTTVYSNRLELQLCTGEVGGERGGAGPREDVGRGCLR
jgi:hypothetical protein